MTFYCNVWPDPEFKAQAIYVCYGSLADIVRGIRGVRFTPKADMLIAGINVRYVPQADICKSKAPGLSQRVKNGQVHRHRRSPLGAEADISRPEARARPVTLVATEG